MKIVHITSHLVRKAAGVREVVLELSRAQKKIGIDVFVLGLVDQDWKYEMNDWDGMPVSICKVLGPRALGYSPKMLDKLNEINPDVVHLHGLWMHHNRCVLQWHLQTKKPYIVSPHGMLSPVALSYSPLKKKLVSIIYQNSVFQNASLLHATCNQEVSEFRNYNLTNKSVIIPNGISNMDVPNIDQSYKRTILSLGRIHKKKALDQLIKAWAILENDFPEWRLEIVGPDEGGESLRLNELISHLRLQRAEVKPPIFGKDKINLMASAGIFALPTKSENFALTVAESLMLSVPVISSKGAPWERLEEEKCGRWIPFGWQSMAASLSELMLLSDEERAEMGRRGRAWMQREFSWQSIAKKFNETYLQLLD